MQTIHQLAMYLHIAIGFVALIVFWVPTLARKGSANHKRYGKIFSWGMYAISFSGILMSGMDLLFPLAMHMPDAQLSPDQAEGLRSQVRTGALFLFSLSVLVLCTTRHGWLTIVHKDNRKALRSPVHVALCVSLLVVGCLLAVIGLMSTTIVFMVFGVLQIVIAARSIRYIFRKQLRPKEWWLQHLSGLFGSGIGAYTAFFVFGGSRLFSSIFSELPAQFSIVLWIGPGIIGAVGIAFVSRHYKQRFWSEEKLTVTA